MRTDFSGHIEWHLEMGLMLKIVEAPLALQGMQDLVPQTLYDQCKMLGQPFTGNAAGRASVSDLRGLKRSSSGRICRYSGGG